MPPAAHHRSPLARQVKGVRDPMKDGANRDPWGMLLHTTGGGVTDLAVYSRKIVAGKIIRTKRPKPLVPLDVAIKIYIASQNGSNGYKWGGPGYVMDFDGSLHQLAPDNKNTAHCGGYDRAHYLSGAWEKMVSVATLAAWKHQWKKYRNPYSLFPSTSPNVNYVGIEMLPCGDGFGTPMRPGLRFTQQQHDSAISLALDLAVRHGWPKGWHRTGRLVGHEDVQILNRMDPGGGWDPGWLRDKPYFDFEYVRVGIGIREACR